MYKEYVNQFHNGNPIELYFIEKKLKGDEDQTEVEHILDFLYSKPTLKIERLGYSTIKEKADKWTKKLQQVSSKDNEVEGVDYEVFMDFGDGFRFVKLISKACYEREGKNMSHCVSSYYGRDSKIYSLRDSKNLPHCTIESGNQIKGKGNGKIDPKYIDYVVKFLEKTGMTVGENEMKNLGYVDLSKLKTDLDIEFSESTKKLLYKDKYYPVNKGIDGLKDVDDNPIRTLELLDYFPMFEEKETETSFSLKLAIDIPLLAKGFVEFIKKSNTKNKVEKAEDNAKVSAGNYAKVSAGYNAKVSAEDYAKVSAGNYATVSAEYNAKVSAENYAKVSAEDYAKVSAEDYAKVSAGYNAKVSAGNYATVSAGNYATVSAGNYATVSAGYNATVSAGYNAKVSVGYNAKVSAGYNAKVSAEDNAKVSAGNYAKVSAEDNAKVSAGNNATVSAGKHSILVAETDSKLSGEIGTILLLTKREYIDGFYKITDWKAEMIDGEILKENTWYVLKDGEFIISE